MVRRLRNAAVVITGASSGIGRATALEFARCGANVALAARREEALQDVARECEACGVQALVVPTDVAQEEAVENLARETVAHFGRIDVWVNNAAVTMFGKLEDVPAEAFRKIIDTNLMGYTHGMQSVLPYFREQGYGTLINVSSAASVASQPYTSAYVCSKAAIRSLSECARMELSLDEARDIHICTVMPASIDTPLFQHGANYTGRTPQPMPPVYSVEQAAREIVAVAKSPEREVVIGSAGRLMMRWKRLAPALYERYAARQVDQTHLSQSPASESLGNLFEPVDDHAGASGGWRSRQNAGINPWLVCGLAMAVPLLMWWAARPGELPAANGRFRNVRNRRRKPARPWFSVLG